MPPKNGFIGFGYDQLTMTADDEGRRIEQRQKFGGVKSDDDAHIGKLILSHKLWGFAMSTTEDLPGDDDINTSAFAGSQPLFQDQVIHNAIADDSVTVTSALPGIKLFAAIRSIRPRRPSWQSSRHTRQKAPQGPLATAATCGVEAEGRRATITLARRLAFPQTIDGIEPAADSPPPIRRVCSPPISSHPDPMTDQKHGFHTRIVRPLQVGRLDASDEAAREERQTV
jgi:hypothetical protein